MRSASYFKWAFSKKRPIVPKCALGFAYEEDGLYQFYLPRAFSASKAVTLGAAADSCSSDPERIIMKLHVNRGPGSAH